MIIRSISHLSHRPRNTGGGGGGVVLTDLLSRQRTEGRGSVLRYRDFRRLWLSESVAALGDQIFPIAATAMAILAFGERPTVHLALGLLAVSLLLATRPLLASPGAPAQA